jgi:hypothetical protein
MSTNLFERIRPRSRFSYDLNVSMASQEHPQIRAGKRLIVNNQSSNGVSTIQTARVTLVVPGLYCIMGWGRRP